MHTAEGLAPIQHNINEVRKKTKLHEKARVKIWLDTTVLFKHVVLTRHLNELESVSKQKGPIIIEYLIIFSKD